MNKVLIFCLLQILSLTVMGQNLTPQSSDAKRAWNIANMYIDEGSPELAISELKKVINAENFAPAYLKVVELCYQLGDSKHSDMAEDYTREFIALWPDRADEVKDVAALGEARIKLMKRKFLESLIGDWHPEFSPMHESPFSLKIRKHESGGVYVTMPKEIYDADYITEWQEGRLLWNTNNEVVIYEAQYAPYEGYRVKDVMDSGNFWNYIYMCIPLNQPEITDGKIKVTGEVKMNGPYGGHSYQINAVLIKD